MFKGCNITAICNAAKLLHTRALTSLHTDSEVTAQTALLSLHTLQSVHTRAVLSLHTREVKSLDLLAGTLIDMFISLIRYSIYGIDSYLCRVRIFMATHIFIKFLNKTPAKFKIY